VQRMDKPEYNRQIQQDFDKELVAFIDEVLIPFLLERYQQHFLSDHRREEKDQ
jgi:hypothetical protein